MKATSTILIVDDEPSVHLTLEAHLFQENYRLAFANSGREALDRIEEIEPDAILLDVMMPEIDGFEVCRRLKGDERWQHVPIILVTALDGKDDLARGLGAGADDFIHKPVNSTELRARLRSMLRIKKQYDQLKAVLRLREDLSNMIVHDMRSPLATISLYSQLLQRKVTSPDALKRIDTIRTQAGRLNAFMDDMLMLAKMEQANLVLNRSPVNVNQLALAAERSQREIAQFRGINLVTNLPAESRPIMLDANLFQRVLDNLLSNTLKFAPAGSTVTLRVAYSEGLCVQVIDQGPGVPAEHREAIFEKFQVAPLKERGVAQTGLGLAFCRLVVEAHGGRIWVEDNEPKGAIFTVKV